LDDPWLSGRSYSLKVGNRPMAYILEEEEEELSPKSFPVHYLLITLSSDDI
jgi:hypothetical protein